MSDNQVNNLLGVTMEKIKQMVDVNTVIGDPVTTPDGTTVIPISRVSYGFASGGSDLPSKAQPSSGLFAGGSGAGITINPIAFLAIQNGNVRILQIEPLEKRKKSKMTIVWKNPLIRYDSCYHKRHVRDIILSRGGDGSCMVGYVKAVVSVSFLF